MLVVGNRTCIYVLKLPNRSVVRFMTHKLAITFNEFIKPDLLLFKLSDERPSSKIPDITDVKVLKAACLIGAINRG